MFCVWREECARRVYCIVLYCFELYCIVLNRFEFCGCVGECMSEKVL